MSGFAGYKSVEDFQKAVDRELTQMQTHHRGARDDTPKPKALKGKPGSPERLRQAARAAGVDEQTFLNTVTRNETGKKLVKAVKKLNGEFSREALEEAAELTVSLRDEAVARAAMNAMSPETAQAYYERMVAIAEGKDTTSEQERVAARQKLLADEYEMAGPYVETVDRLAHDHADALYELEDHEVQTLLRSGGILAQSEQEALETFAINAQLDDELKRVAGPGSTWNDAERDKWERELEAGSLESYDRRRLTPDQAIQVAADSTEPKPSLEDLLDAELGAMATHNRENLERERSR